MATQTHGEKVHVRGFREPLLLMGEDKAGRALVSLERGIKDLRIAVPQEDVTPLGRIPPPPFLHHKWTDESEWPRWSWIAWPVGIALLIAGLGFGVWLGVRVPAPPWMMVMILGGVIAYGGWRAWKA